MKKRNLLTGFLDYILLDKKIIITFLCSVICECILMMSTIIIPTLFLNFFNDENVAISNVIYKIIFTTIIIVLLDIVIKILEKIELHLNRKNMLKYRKNIFSKVQNEDYETSCSSKYLDTLFMSLEQGSEIMYENYLAMKSIVCSIIKLVIIMFLFGYFNYILGIVVLLVIIIYLYFGSKRAKLGFKITEKNKRNNRIRDLLIKAFYMNDHIFDLKNSNIGEHLVEENKKVGDAIVEIDEKFMSKLAVYTILSNFIIYMIYPLSLIFAAKLVIENQIITAFASLTISSSYLYTSIFELVDSLSYGQVISSNLNSIFKFEKSNYNKPLNNIMISPNIISFSNVYFKYKNAREYALYNINLNIKKGQKIVIIGPNGSGKTTLINLITGLLIPSTGEILFDNKPLNVKLNNNFQNFITLNSSCDKLFAFKIKENILLEPSSLLEKDNVVWDSLDFVDMRKKIANLEGNIERFISTEFDEDGVNFSGGEEKKLLIARSIVSDKEFIIMDEPNSSLDPFSEIQLIEKMMSLDKNKTIIFISHRLSCCKKADLIIYLENGKIVEQGTHNELMKNINGKYYKLFNETSECYIRKDSANE